jgi:hypothetical protein
VGHICSLEFYSLDVWTKNARLVNIGTLGV